jgi:predicted esterase
LVALHGTGGDGRAILDAFRSLADERGFAIVGPDSRKTPNGTFSWEVGDKPGEVTDDYRHVVACMNEALGQIGADADRSRILIAGHSGGASSAPYIATNRRPFSAFAVLHGGVFEGGLGHRDVRGWFSTGTQDTVRSPAHVRDALERARKQGGLSDLTYREFPGGHGVSAAEAKALVDWWLGEAGEP